MRPRSAFILPVLTLGLALLACNFPRLASPQADQAATETLVALASQIAPTLEPLEATPTQAARVQTESPAATDTPSPSATPTITPTDTPSIPIARLSQNTNCRSGPGTIYDIEYIAMAGEDLVIAARSSVPNYVIVEIPGSPGQTCWLWTQYAEISGDTSSLPVQTPPPTPTPQPTETPALAFSMSQVDISLCSGKEYLEIQISNTGSLAIESFSFQARDLDTNETASRQGNIFKRTIGCLAFARPSIAPGGSAYLGVGPFTGFAGHTVRVTMTACAADDLGQQCSQMRRDFSIPSPSDRSLKEHFTPVDPMAILAGVETLPITSWSYIADEGSARHIGPMAQDFNRIFGVGRDDGYISAVDANGVALASIQALKAITEAQSAQIAALESRLAEIEEQNRHEQAVLTIQMLASFAFGAGAIGACWVYAARRRRRRSHERLGHDEP